MFQSEPSAVAGGQSRTFAGTGNLITAKLNHSLPQTVLTFK